MLLALSLAQLSSESPETEVLFLVPFELCGVPECTDQRLRPTRVFVAELPWAFVCVVVLSVYMELWTVDD